MENGTEMVVTAVEVIPPEAQWVPYLGDVDLSIATEFRNYLFEEAPSLQAFTATIHTGHEDDDGGADNLPLLEVAGRIEVTRVRWDEMGTRSDIVDQLDASETLYISLADFFTPHGILQDDIAENWEDDEALLVITDLWLNPEVRGMGVLQAAIVNLQRCLRGIVIWNLRPEIEETGEREEDQKKRSKEALLKVRSYLMRLGFRSGPSLEYLWLPAEVLAGWAGEDDEENLDEI